MNDSINIHETVLGSIMSAWDDLNKMRNGDTLKSIVGDPRNYRTKNPMAGMSSISKAVSNMTLVFPVICSRGIDIEHSSMVTKALERNAVSMLQRLFAARQISDQRDLMGYVNQFHNNISSGVASLDDIYNLIVNDSAVMEINNADIHAVRMDMPNWNTPVAGCISETSLNDFVVREGAARPKYRPVRANGQPYIGDNVTIQGDFKHDDAIQGLKNAAEYFNKQVVDSDFKKANELTPTLMTVNFKVLNNDGTALTSYDSALVGVKAKLYPVSSKDIVEHIGDKVAGRNWLTNFFRATTREISFLKDFVLAVDKAKSDALALSSKNPTADKMWKVLERRATDSKFRRLMLSNNNAAAITTLCISQEEVEYLRKNNNIDLESLRVIRGLFESLNLMCICIVDESLEVAKFVYDEAELMWETLSFNHLEREASDNAYKKVVNMITKVSH